VHQRGFGHRRSIAGTIRLSASSSEGREVAPDDPATVRPWSSSGKTGAGPAHRFRVREESVSSREPDEMNFAICRTANQRLRSSGRPQKTSGRRCRLADVRGRRKQGNRGDGTPKLPPLRAPAPSTGRDGSAGAWARTNMAVGPRTPRPRGKLSDRQGAYWGSGGPGATPRLRPPDRRFVER